MSAPPETTEDATAPEARSALADRLRRRRAKRSLLERVSIQSKLMLMLLTTSLWNDAGAADEHAEPALGEEKLADAVGAV